MQRLASGFATLWIMLFVPSLIVWLLVIRWGETDAGRFGSVWNWVVDLIAFPLMLSPFTDWSWQQLESGSMLTATIGFLILNAVWAALFALPLALISAWWRKIGDRTVGDTSALSATYGDGYTTSLLPIPGRESSSPLAALYVLTLPLALVWSGIRRAAGGLNGSPTGVIKGALGLFALTFILVTLLMAAIFGLASYWDRYDVIGFVSDTLWYGYLDTLRIPKLFPDRWIDALVTVYTVSDHTDPHEWPQYMGQWYRHDEFRTLVGLTAARHGLAVVMIYLAWRLLRRVFG